MTSEDAYNTICNVFYASKKRELVNSFFDIDNFGNFVVEFLDETGGGAVICDRGQVHVCADSSGTKDCRLLVQSLDETTEQELTDVVERITAASK